MKISFLSEFCSRRLWLWVGLQLLTGVAAILLLQLFRSKFALIIGVQWAAIATLLYFQIRQAKLKGIEIVIPEVLFTAWNKLGGGAWSQLEIVYKKRRRPDGNIGFCVFPVNRSRWSAINQLKIVFIRALVLIRLIN